MTAMRTMGLAPVLPPDATVTETRNEYVVSLAVPGFARQELEVEVADHTLTIRGNQTRTPADDGTFKIHEALEESFRLPVDVDAAYVTATFAHGTIEIHAPRIRKPPSRRIVPIRRRPLWNPDVTGS